MMNVVVKTILSVLIFSGSLFLDTYGNVQLSGSVYEDSLYYPNYTYEYVPDPDYYEIEERFSALSSEMPLTYNTRIKAFIDYFTIRNREYTKTVLGRIHLYFPLFEKYFKEYGIPDDIKYLAIVESGLNPRAGSRVGAVGLWQFMPATAKMYGMDIDWYIDERMDPEKSTEAACKYLRSLYNYFNDWDLALAAYNAGPGKVRRAIRKSGYKKDFWEIYRYLPRETRSYVPQFLAILYVVNYASEHNFIIEEYNEYLPETDTIIVNDFLYFKTFADLTNICAEDLEKLNPSVRRRAIPESENEFVLHIPYDIKPYFLENRKWILDSAKNTGKEELEYLARNSVGSTYGRDKVIHTVRSGEVLGTIANKYKVRISDLRSWNNIHGNLIRINQKLKIWVNQNYYQSLSAKSSPQIPRDTPQILPSSKTHLVQPGDSLWKISRQYEGLTIERIKKLNNLKSDRLVPGQKLIIG